MDEFLKKVVDSLRQEYQECDTPVCCTQVRRFCEMVPMRDGVRLETFAVLPRTGRQTYPVILERTCYPMWDVTMQVHGEELAKRGYAFVYQYCRGQHGSEGDWAPNVYERNDGIDTVRWLAAQSWAGRIGLQGRSYGALVGWAMADAVTDQVAAMYLAVYGTDRFVSAYEKGSFRHDVLTSWTMENAGFKIAADYEESCRYLPQAQVDEDLWGRRIDWYRDYILNENVTDDYWQGGFWKQLREIPRKVRIPLYITSGWYDHHHGSSMVTWERLNAQAKAHSWLEITALNHFQFSCIEGRPTFADQKDDLDKKLAWFDLTLVKGQLPQQKIRLYEIGADQWAEPAGFAACGESHTADGVCVHLGITADGKRVLTAKHVWSMQGAKTGDTRSMQTAKTAGSTADAEDIRIKGTLQELLPEAAIQYVYDPEDPVRTHGGEALLHTAKEIGSLLQPPPDWRPDVISFLGEPLSADLRIFGKIRVRLWVRSDCTDTAFTAKLMEVFPDGRTYNIRSSITTICSDVPGGDYTPGDAVQVQIEMWDIFYRVREGNRLRLDISSSDFPQYHVHANEKGKWALQTKNRRARQTILCGETYDSQVLIPVWRE